MSLLSLPDETLRIVLHHLYSETDADTLVPADTLQQSAHWKATSESQRASTSLLTTCKRLHMLAEPMLCRRVCLTKGDAIWSFCRRMEEHQHLRNEVTDILVSLARHDTDAGRALLSLVRLLPMCPALRRLAMEQDRGLHMRYNISGLVQQLKALRWLELRQKDMRDTPWIGIQPVLRALQTEAIPLEAFVYHSAMVLPVSNDPADPFRAPESIISFSLVTTAEMAQDGPSGFIQPLVALERLHLGVYCSEDQLRDLMAALIHRGGTLTHLSLRDALGLPLHLVDGLLRPAMAMMPNLEELALQDSDCEGLDRLIVPATLRRLLYINSSVASGGFEMLIAFLGGQQTMNRWSIYVRGPHIVEAVAHSVAALPWDVPYGLPYQDDSRFALLSSDDEEDEADPGVVQCTDNGNATA